MHDRQVASEELLTERLSLRRPTTADIELIYSLHSNQRACAHNPSDMLATRADAEILYQRWDDHWQRHGFGYWVLRPHMHVAVGFCGIKLMQFRDREILNLFYRLDPSAWGSGLATESAIAVVGWATANKQSHPVIARVRPSNAASLRVAERAGLHRAEHLDSPGEDGLDYIFTSAWLGNQSQVLTRT